VRGKTIAVTSAKGGVGVTTTAINLGVALTKQYRKEVIVADFRPGQGSLGIDLGYSNSQGLNHLLSYPLEQLTGANVEAELMAHLPNLRLLLASSFPQDARYLSAVDYFSAIANHLTHLSQVTVLDLGPGVTPINEQILPTCEQVVVVLEPVAQNIAQTRSYVEYLDELGLQGNRVLLVLVNRIRAGVQLALGQVQDQLKHPINVIFTAAPELAYQASIEHMPLMLVQEEGIAAKQFITLAELVERQLR
jgi:pilus assembly protein CpaE